MSYADPSNRSRIAAAVAAIALQCLIGYALLSGLAGRLQPAVVEGLQVFNIAAPPPPPPEKIVPHRVTSHRRAGRAAPPNLKAKAAAIVAPPPVVPPEVPPPVLAALTPGAGAADHAGAAAVPGPGTGLAGQGTGTGSGSDGNGDGDGGEPSVWIKGRIRDSDYPPAALKAGIGGTVYLRFVVGANGRVTDCMVTRSSGNADLDETTCRLIKQRARYKPALDAAGRKIPDIWRGEHVWTTSREAPPPEPEER